MTQACYFHCQWVSWNSFVMNKIRFKNIHFHFLTLSSQIQHFRLSQRNLSSRSWVIFCSAPALVLTLRLDDHGENIFANCECLWLRCNQDFFWNLTYPGNHHMMMPRLLAHEFGHLLGSDHDGDVARSVGVITDDVYGFSCVGVCTASTRTYQGCPVLPVNLWCLPQLVSWLLFTENNNNNVFTNNDN